MEQSLSDDQRRARKVRRFTFGVSLAMMILCNAIVLVGLWAADLIKLAMIGVQKVLDREQRATRMIMQVHDELVFEVPAAELVWAREAVPRIMAGVATLAVPLVADVGVGANWEEAH